MIFFTLFLFLFINFSHSSSTSQQSTESETVIDINSKITTIEANHQRVLELNMSLPWMDIAKNQAPFFETLKQTYDHIFNNTTEKKCHFSPSELFLTYFFTIPEEGLEDFLNETMIKELPENVQNKLLLLKLKEKKRIMTDTFAQLLTLDGQESFEIGHVMLQSTFDNVTKESHLLLLVPVVKAILKKDCYFTEDFRKNFIGNAQAIQNYLAVKAAQNSEFVEALKGFSDLEGEIIDTKVGEVH